MSSRPGIEIQMDKLLTQFDSELTEAAESVIDEVTKEAVNRLKSTSPKLTGAYAKSWTVKRTGPLEKTIYNKDYAWKTSLLENGHVIKNKKGVFGRSPAHPHIKPVEEWAAEELVARLNRRLPE